MNHARATWFAGYNRARCAPAATKQRSAAGRLSPPCTASLGAGYSSGGPEKRVKGGTLSFFAYAGLLVATLAAGIRLVLSAA